MTHKKSILSVLTACSIIAVPFTYAADTTDTLSDQEKNAQIAGVGGGALIGGLAAGPAGAIVGGMISVLFVDKQQNVHRLERSAQESNQQAETIQQELVSVSAELAALQTELDSAQLKTDELHAHTIELIRQRDLLQSIEHEIRFDTDTYELAEADLARLLKLSNVVAQLPESEVHLEGYADVRGDDAYNETLSMDRAYAVAEAMNSFGVAQQQIRTYGFGESEATAVDHRSLGQDRRVSIQLAPLGEPRIDQELAARLSSAQRSGAQRYAAARRAHACDNGEEAEQAREVVSIEPEEPVKTNPQASSMPDNTARTHGASVSAESVNVGETLDDKTAVPSATNKTDTEATVGVYAF